MPENGYGLKLKTVLSKQRLQKVKGSLIHCKSGNVFEIVEDRDIP